jgi:hypothetical protein
MNKFLTLLLLIPSSIFCSIESIERDLKIEINISKMEMEKSEPGSREFNYNLGKIYGLIFALECIEKDSYGPNAILFPKTEINWSKCNE